MSAALADEASAISVVEGSERTYGAVGKKGSIGRIWQTSDGAWHAEPSTGSRSVHTGPMARWDASHALTLAYMRSME